MYAAGGRAENTDRVDPSYSGGRPGNQLAAVLCTLRMLHGRHTCKTCRLWPRQEQDKVGRSCCVTSPAGGAETRTMGRQRNEPRLAAAMPEGRDICTLVPKHPPTIPVEVGSLRMVSFMSSVSASCATAERSTLSISPMSTVKAIRLWCLLTTLYWLGSNSTSCVRGQSVTSRPAAGDMAARQVGNEPS